MLQRSSTWVGTARCRRRSRICSKRKVAKAASRPSTTACGPSMASLAWYPDSWRRSTAATQRRARTSPAWTAWSRCSRSCTAHRSVTGYRREGDRWVAELHESAVERAQHEDGTRHFQDAAVSGLAEIVRTGRAGTIAADDLTRETALAAITAVGLSPTVEEM